MSFYQLKREQRMNASLQEAWDFISSPKNLSEITPDHMGFQITSDAHLDKMYEGMIITYKVSPLFGIKLNWMTEITHVKEHEYFVDEQRIGPYALWHHQHFIEPIEHGILMQDIVTYRPPFGLIGAVLNKLIIRGKLVEIFEYRHKAIEEKFGKYQGTSD